MDNPNLSCIEHMDTYYWWIPEPSGDLGWGEHCPPLPPSHICVLFTGLSCSLAISPLISCMTTPLWIVVETDSIVLLHSPLESFLPPVPISPRIPSAVLTTPVCFLFHLRSPDDHLKSLPFTFQTISLVVLLFPHPRIYLYTYTFLFPVLPPLLIHFPHRPYFSCITLLPFLARYVRSL
jgi:hypothetical protein